MKQGQHQILHSPVWVYVLARHLEAAGHAPKGLLKECGFHADGIGQPDERVDIETIVQFFELASTRFGDDLLGFHFGTKIDVRDAGLIAFVGVNAPTLADGMKNTAAYARVFGDAIEFDLRRFETEGQLTYLYHLPPSKPRRQYVEWYAAGCVATLRHITKAPIWCEHVSFSHPRNAHVDEIERFFGCRVSFAAPSNTITFKMSDLDTPIVAADQKLLTLLHRIATDTLNRTTSNRPSLQEQVERVILGKMASGKVTLDDVAPDLGMSTRSLSRKLAALELSYSDVLSNLRAALATRYLQDSDLSVTEIAFLLGYADGSSFSAAFRQWTGQSPRDLRKG